MACCISVPACNSITEPWLALYKVTGVPFEQTLEQEACPIHGWQEATPVPVDINSFQASEMNPPEHFNVDVPHMARYCAEKFIPV